ncbi:hypothetical protein HYC85_029756 [Camellia sinensis]|uniref:CCHC-type domain-containing protein n=1 Tax=Camellia sinensis TaxID=4442 RepID=A0A7J7FZL8_CAMSI|nr:hypothetical protein HYC85_029756 [Camellia sinensis]
MLVEEKEELAMQLTEALLAMEEEKAIWSAKEKASIEAIEEKGRLYNAETMFLSEGISEIATSLIMTGIELPGQLVRVQRAAPLDGKSCSSVDSEEFEPEVLVDSEVAHRQDNSEVKTGLEETYRGWFNSSVDSLESKVVGKILRFLPDRFQPKVTAIEEAQDVDNLKLDQLVGNLQTYEEHRNFKKKQKDAIAFSSAHRVGEDSDEDCEIDSKITAAFVKQFKKSFLKKNPNLLESTHTHKSKGKDKLKINSIAKKEKGKIQGNSERVQCYECQGFGHFAQECPTRLRKKKALAITWDDESESNIDESDNEDQGEEGHKQFIAFMAASETEGRTKYPKRSVENAIDDESSESDDEELEQAYEKLYKESLKLSKLNDKLTMKLTACESENVKLNEEIFEARIDAIKIANDQQALYAKLLTCETERNELQQIYATYGEKIETLEMSQVALEELMIKKKEELKCAMATIGLWNKRSKTLDNIIGSQQICSDKSGIGFGDNKEQKQSASTSHETRTQGKGEQKIQHKDGLLKLPRVVCMVIFALIVISCMGVSHKDERNSNISWGKRHFIGCNEVKGHIRPRYFDLLETNREQRFCLSSPRNRKLETKSRRVLIESKGNHNVKTPPKNRNAHNFVYTKAVWCMHGRRSCRPELWSLDLELERTLRRLRAFARVPRLEYSYSYIEPLEMVDPNVPNVPNPDT